MDPCSRVVRTFLDVLCDVIGEGVYALLRQAAEKIGTRPNSLAATLGMLLGVYRDGRVPRRIVCVDLVRAFEIKSDYDEEYVYGEPSEDVVRTREKSSQVFASIFLEATHVLARIFVERLGGPDEVVKTISECRESIESLSGYSLSVEGDEISVMLCYRDPKAAEYASGLRYGGFLSNAVAYSLARKHGFRGISILSVKRRDSCVEFRFKGI